MKQELLFEATLTLGECCEEVAERALRAWVKAWRGTRSSDDMIANKLMAEEIQVVQDRRTNKLNVLATLRGRAGTPGHTEWCVYRRVAYNRYQEILKHKV